MWEFKKENKQWTFCTYWSHCRKVQGKRIDKKKNHLINKLKKLKNSTGKKGKQKTTSYKKQAVINLADTELKNEHTSLLNLEPNFVSATKRIPFMDIMSATETCAIDLENSSKETDFYVKK